MINWIPFIYGVSTLIFNSIFEDENCKYISFVLIIVGLVYAFLPVTSINYYLFPPDNKDYILKNQNKKYDRLELTFE